MYNKTIIRFGFCDIQNNQGLGKGYQPQPSASADNPYLDLDYSGYHKNLIQQLFRSVNHIAWCHSSVFTDQSICSLNLPPIETPTKTSMTNHKHELNL